MGSLSISNRSKEQSGVIVVNILQLFFLCFLFLFFILLLASWPQPVAFNKRPNASCVWNKDYHKRGIRHWQMLNILYSWYVYSPLQSHSTKISWHSCSWTGTPLARLWSFLEMHKTIWANQTQSHQLLLSYGNEVLIILIATNSTFKG